MAQRAPLADLRQAEAADHCRPSGYRPLPLPPEADRIHIADRLREKASIRQIAAELGRSPSTVSREIRRNGALWRRRDWVYRPHAAHRRAEERRPRPKSGKIGQNSELRDFIQHHLSLHESPEQICQALRTAFPGRQEMHVAHETIYQALYVQGRGNLPLSCSRHLRTGRTMRRHRDRQSDKRRPRTSADKVMISNGPPRPPTAPSPATGKATSSSGKDQKSRSAPSSSADPLRDARPPPRRLRRRQHAGRAGPHHADACPHASARSADLGPGARMSRHKEFTIATDIAVYFCDPAAPGSAARTRTPTACCGSTSPRAPTSPATAASTWTPWPPS